jgi:hypothetical protein
MLRTLGKLDMLQQLVEEEQLSPSEYYNMVQASKPKQRKRAVGKLKNAKQEESEPTEQREPSNSFEWASREGGGQSQW